LGTGAFPVSEARGKDSPLPHHPRGILDAKKGPDPGLKVDFDFVDATQGNAQFLQSTEDEKSIADGHEATHKLSVPFIVVLETVHQCQRMHLVTSGAESICQQFDYRHQDPAASTPQRDIRYFFQPVKRISSSLEASKYLARCSQLSGIGTRLPVRQR
jgi:hypothetical protein